MSKDFYDAEEVALLSYWDTLEIAAQKNTPQEISKIDLWVFKNIKRELKK